MAIGGLSGCDVEPGITDDAARFALHADEHRLGQLLRTLIEHALQRDPQRRPEVLLSVAGDRLQIRTRDRGPALDASERSALFSQPQPSPFDDGLGLRLLLARKIAEAHGGTLGIDEAVDDGLATVCTLPSNG